jgi:hypothetical protein
VEDGNGTLVLSIIRRGDGIRKRLRKPIGNMV